MSYQLLVTVYYGSEGVHQISLSFRYQKEADFAAQKINNSPNHNVIKLYEV